MTNIRRILCPVDFSDCSRHALVRALALGRTYDAALTVLHVIDDEPERGKCELERFVRGVDSSGGETTCVIVEGSHVDEEILSRARSLLADLIVIGTHSRSGFQRLMLGSVAESVLRQSDTPVLTVPPGGHDGQSSTAPIFQRILCPVDFSQWSLAGLQYALSLARQHGARLAVFHAIELMAPTYDPVVGPLYDPLASAPTEPEYRTASEIVTRERLRSLLPPHVRGTVVIEELVEKGRARDEIVHVAADWKSDLIVLGTHGRHTIDRAVFGSTVEPVVRRAPCPVLTVPAALCSSNAIESVRGGVA